MTKNPVNDYALDQIWRQGRSYNGWTTDSVPETLIRATYDLTKMGMTRLVSPEVQDEAHVLYGSAGFVFR